MAIRVAAHRRSHVEPGHVVFHVDVQEIWVHGVAHVGGNQEGVCVGLIDEVRAGGGLEGIDDALDDGGEEIAVCALAEERADFFVVEEADEFDDGGAGWGGGVVGGVGGGTGVG